MAAAAALIAPVAAADPLVHDGESPPALAWHHAMENGDLAALARMHDSATTAFPPDAMQIEGADAILRGYRDLFAKYRVGVSVRDAHWVEQPPLVVSWGLTTLTLHPKAGGADVSTTNRFTDAAVVVPGGWRYIVDHASTPGR